MKYLLLSTLFLMFTLSSCDKDVPGCMDPTAANFNPEATVGDGNCQYGGCTDPDADNYDPNATVDSGNCMYNGCIDNQSDQFDPTANTDDASCETYFNRWTASFSGDFNCTQAIVSDAFGVAVMTFSQIEGSGYTDSIEVSIETSLSSIPLNFNAYLTRDSLYAAAFFPDYLIEVEGVDIIPMQDDIFDISVNGVLGINEENTEISGVLTVDLKHKTIPINPMDQCQYTGVRQ